MSIPNPAAQSHQSPMRDLEGTTYLAPDGSMYRLVRYEIPIIAEDTPDAREEPVYNYWGPRGGAANGVYALPEHSTRILLPTPDRPAEGSVFLDDTTGHLYRLRDYGIDWDTMEHTVPHWQVALTGGGFTNADTLPEGVRLIWAPAPGAGA